MDAVSAVSRVSKNSSSWPADWLAAASESRLYRFVLNTPMRMAGRFPGSTLRHRWGCHQVIDRQRVPGAPDRRARPRGVSPTSSSAAEVFLGRPGAANSQVVRKVHRSHSEAAGHDLELGRVEVAAAAE